MYYFVCEAIEFCDMRQTKTTASPSIPKALKWSTIAAPVPAPKAKAIQIPLSRPIWGSEVLAGGGTASEVYFSTSAEIRVVIIPVRNVV